MIQQIGEPAHDGKPQSKSFLVTTAGPYLVKLYEYLLELILFDADTCVSDFNMAMPITFDTLHRYFSRVGISDRVRDKVLNNLAEQIRIAADYRRTGIGFKNQPFVLRLPRKFSGQPVDQALHRKFFQIRGNRACIQATDVEERIQEIGHRRERMLLAFDHLKGPFIFDGAAQRAI